MARVLLMAGADMSAKDINVSLGAVDPPCLRIFGTSVWKRETRAGEGRFQGGREMNSFLGVLLAVWHWWKLKGAFRFTFLSVCFDLELQEYKLFASAWQSDREEILTPALSGRAKLAPRWPADTVIRKWLRCSVMWISQAQESNNFQKTLSYSRT